MDKYIIIFSTVPTKDAGNEIADKLIGEELAACVNIIPGIESIYKWKGDICRESELLLVIKSRESLFDSIKEKILSMHPYELPEVVSFQISDGHDQYLKWIDECTKS